MGYEMGLDHKEPNNKCFRTSVALSLILFVLLVTKAIFAISYIV